MPKLWERKKEKYQVSAYDQYCRVRYFGFQFNTNGSLMNRPVINKPDEIRIVFIPKGKLPQSCVERNNGYEFIDEPVLEEQELEAVYGLCGWELV